MTPVEAYLNWKRKRTDVACLFARQIAIKPERYAQRIESISGASATANQIASNISRRIDRLVGDPTAAAAVILLPQVTDLKRAAAAFLALGGKTHWQVSTSLIQGPPCGDMVAIHISRLIPFGANPPCLSEALVLGPFDEFAPTRRAPRLGFEIYVGEPRPLDPKTRQPTKKANLAHIEMFLPSDATFKKMWDDTVERRLKSLGDQEDPRAKAKVSLVIPLAVADELGCKP